MRVGEEMLGRMEAKSTLTDRYQTTIPEFVRESLHIGKRDKILYTLEEGRIVISKAEENDPVLGQFLSLLADDIKNHPTQVQMIHSSLLERAQKLVSGVKLDLNSALSDEDE